MWIVAFCCLMLFFSPFFLPLCSLKLMIHTNLEINMLKVTHWRQEAGLHPTKAQQTSKFWQISKWSSRNIFADGVLNSSTSNNSTLSFGIRIDLRCYSLLISLCVSCVHNKCSISFHCKYSHQIWNSLLRTELWSRNCEIENSWICMGLNLSNNPHRSECILQFMKKPQGFLPTHCLISRIILCT